MVVPDGRVACVVKTVPGIGMGIGNGGQDIEEFLVLIPLLAQDIQMEVREKP